MAEPSARRRHQPTVPAAVRVLLIADLAVAALYILDATLGHPSSTLRHLVDMDGESNLPTWYESGQLLVLGLLLGVFAVVQADRRGIRSWPLYALPALALAASLDEICQMHEWLGHRSDVLLANGSRHGSLLPHTGIWVFLLGPPFVIAVVLLGRALAPALRGRRRTARLYCTGFFVFCASALGTEVLSNLVTLGGTSALIQIVCEELGEMVGVTILVWATLDLLASYQVRIRIGDGDTA